jgi:acetyltransferase-like isoleucine patch superfamily enzyme
MAMRFSIGTILKNDVTIKSYLKSSKIVIKGIDNKIEINSGDHKNLRLFIEGNYNHIVFEENIYSRDITLIVQGNKHYIKVGSNTAMAKASLVCCGKNTQKIEIGSNCMFAAGLNIKTCDGHTIYDKDSQIINHSKNVIIGDNVWIAQDVTILKGCKIDNGCIVAMKSLCTSQKYFQKQSMIAGIPAKIIKSNIYWKKENLC